MCASRPGTRPRCAHCTMTQAQACALCTSDPGPGVPSAPVTPGPVCPSVPGTQAQGPLKHPYAVPSVPVTDKGVPLGPVCALKRQ
ncbi:hypothetical protein Cadr_000027022 [Camelus dromedarius]|uniref:Uncharacterized protein n=1 Tax=Camelus dromedarius TaxID=9838 RepID=A0A5N4C4V5_CAMDR|nr:hypothetical protein Cadr_000027022 [Camelus dromedarius]